ncbi:hypothetical protein [Luteococcus sp. OSA5]|uniref:hypothetical protein n=1 Tax=Luteococcus sp. OSA5 TaxID=3401630 RepID=UPI003B4305B5
MNNDKHEIALANERIIEVDGSVTLLPSGALKVEPRRADAYYLSPAGWWSWSPADSPRPSR